MRLSSYIPTPKINYKKRCTILVPRNGKDMIPHDNQETMREYSATHHFILILPTSTANGIVLFIFGPYAFTLVSPHRNSQQNNL